MDKQTKQEIQAWLEGGRDYNDGVYLFSRVAKNRSLLKGFAKGENDYNLSKLPSELCKLIGHKHDGTPATSSKGAAAPASLRVVASPKAKQAAKQAENAHKRLTTPQPGDTEVHTEARHALQRAFRERTSLHGQLEQVTDEEHRKAIAEEIVELTALIDVTVDALKHHEATGKWPDAIQAEIDRAAKEKAANVTIPASVPKNFNFDDMGKVVSRIATLRTYASRDKDKPEKLAKWEAELLFMEQVRDGIIKL